MDVSKSIELTRIEELKIIQNVRLIYMHDLNPIYSKQNLTTQFEVSGDVQGTISCYLCLDNCDLSEAERNYLFPLFTETMNILIGRQITLDSELNRFRIQISPPKISLIPRELSTGSRRRTQTYDLELEDFTYKVLTEYNLIITQ